MCVCRSDSGAILASSQLILGSDGYIIHVSYVIPKVYYYTHAESAVELREGRPWCPPFSEACILDRMSGMIRI